MTEPVVKVCGFTRAEDVQAAAAAGVDWFGFNLWPGSKRAQTALQVRSLVASLPRGRRAIGLFVDSSPTEVRDFAAVAGLHAVQLHGRERAEDWRGFPLPVIKALRVEGPQSLTEASAWDCETLLLDAPGPQPGGNGICFDWALVQQLAAMRRVMVAGGLTPDNVSRAVRVTRPFGVDVASGVERAPGIKDAALIRRFVESARSGCK